MTTSDVDFLTPPATRSPSQRPLSSITVFSAVRRAGTACKGVVNASIIFCRQLRSDLQLQEVPADTSAADVVRAERVSNALSVPLELERLMALGFIICLDALLAMLTVVPLRCLLNAKRLTRWYQPKIGSSSKQWPATTTNGAQVLLMAACLAALRFLDPSILYHDIRGQSAIKLYFLYNVLEVRNLESYPTFARYLTACFAPLAKMSLDRCLAGLPVVVALRKKDPISEGSLFHFIFFWLFFMYVSGTAREIPL